MNINENLEELKNEEQIVLDKLISRMDLVLEKLDKKMKEYVSEAQNADVRINPDLYLAKVLAQKGIADTEGNRKKFLKARDELYHTRLLLQYENAQESGLDEIKIGLHYCGDRGDKFVISWTMPLCRHYILDNAAVEYTDVVPGKHGEEYHTKYKLLVKNQVTLRFTRVVKALNLFPGVFDDNLLEQIRGTEFFSDEYIEKLIEDFNPNEYNPDAAAKIISDEFLQELLERRTTPEFKNIVFSIQKKQGEIIQAPYKRDMIVQGCAGSGKSMIMLHRLPILLYDNPNILKRNSIYVITPSQMYVQLADNMRHQLEISDVNMGTIEQYYDYCISKYPGRKTSEYGKINYGKRISQEQERYIYSAQCIKDICDYYDSIDSYELSLEKACDLFEIQKKENAIASTYAQRVSNQLLVIQNILNKNNDCLTKYFKAIRNTLDSFYTLSATLRHRKNEVIRELTKKISKCQDDIEKAEKEITKLDPVENAVAIENRNIIIEEAKEKIEQFQKEMMLVEEDKEYFIALNKINEKLESVLKPFEGMKNEFSKNEIEDIYDGIDKIGMLIGGYYMLSWEVSKVEDKYADYVGYIKSDIENTEKCVLILQNITGLYLELEYCKKIMDEQKRLSDGNANAIKNAYALIMNNLGIKRSENGNIRAIKHSPYIYLQTIYCYQGAASSKESLLAIDEAQGIAQEELRLLKNVNGDDIIFNMFGDIYQHIEGTKGVDSWDEFSEICEFDYYDMKENYRNASQVTEHCNQVFGMEMKPINTPGKGVHELKDLQQFEEEMKTQLLDDQRAGLAAILVTNSEEANYLLEHFSLYKDKFHDMTDEEFSIHHSRWNIICIEDAKGLEFSSVIVLAGRMSRNERYIAFTRALDDLYIYSDVIDISEYEKIPKKERKDTTDKEKSSDASKENSGVVIDKTLENNRNKTRKNYSNSEVKKFFEDNGLEVIDAREQGGRLWVLGEKTAIRDVVNTAISKFGISGKYALGKETKFKRGWCTKTDK